MYSGSDGVMAHRQGESGWGGGGAFYRLDLATGTATSVGAVAGSQVIWDGARCGTAPFGAGPENGISGRVFQDVDGRLLASGAVGDADHPGISNATVRLFNGSGALVASKTTAADGAYSFMEAGTAGTYYVAVDAPTITNANGTAVGEQTYAHAGLGNTVGSTYGPLCVGAAPNYAQRNDPATGNTASNPANGACYGGRRGATADSGTTLNAKEHVIRIVKGSADVTAANFGFGFNVVTNVTGTQQGTVAQFLINARVIAGANSMRFVPAVFPDQAANASRWWRYSTGADLIVQDQAIETTLDGSAYSNLDGIAPIDTNPTMLGSGGTVGVDALTLPQVPGPELEITDQVRLRERNATVRYLALTHSHTALEITFTLPAPADDARVEFNVIGGSPHDYPNGNGSGRGIFFLHGGDRVIVRNNLILTTGAGALNGGAAIFGGNALDDVTIESNEFRSLGDSVGGINVGANLVGTSVIRRNLFVSIAGPGIYDVTSTSLRIENNTFRMLQGSGSTRDAIYVNAGSATGYTITKNIFSSNGTAGIDGAAPAGVALGADARGIRISQNRFSGNFGNAIDLNNDGVSGNDTACTATATGNSNNNLAQPVITSASVSGGSTLNVQGTYCNDGASYTIEFYEAAAGDGDGTPAAGEGSRYLGSLTGSAGSFNQSIGFTGITPTSVTAIAIRESNSTNGVAGDTSEFSQNFALALVPGINTFACDGKLYYPALNTYPIASGINEVDISTTPYAYRLAFVEHNPQLARTVAVAFNPRDNYLYAAAPESDGSGGLTVHIYRIDVNGAKEHLFGVGPVPPTSNGHLGAEFGADGFLYVVVGKGGDIALLYRFDVETPISQQLPPGYQQIPLSRSVQISDMALSNSVLYAVDNNTDTLIAIDPSTGTVTDVGPTGRDHNAWAMFGGSDGVFGRYVDVGYLSGGQGSLYRFNTATGTATVVEGNNLVSGSFDGARCSSAPFGTPGWDIRGRVFQDTAGNLLADGGVGDPSSNPPISGATVRLFDGAGTAVGAPVTTGADGSYALPDVSTGTYYVTVDAPTITNSTHTAVGEQTYAHAGLGNGGTPGSGTNPSGYGALCVGPAPTYAQQNDLATGNTASNPANGACYGGRRGATADSGTTLNDKEHVIRVVVNSAAVTAVDFGFGFNVVTNVTGTEQGTVAKFLTNALVIAGANSMHFVPTVFPDQTANANRWWRYSTGATLIVRSQAIATTLDGRAYSNVDGLAPIDTNPTMLGSGGTVGVDALTLPQLPGPELELADQVALRERNAIVRYLALTNPTIALSVENTFPVPAHDARVEFNVIGGSPHDYPNGNGGNGSVAGIRLSEVARPMIRHNLFLTGNWAGISNFFPASIVGATIEYNEFRSPGDSDIAGGILLSTGGLAGTSVIEGNLFASIAGPGIYDVRSSSLRIENNTFRMLQGSGDTRDAIYVNAGSATGYTITKNIFSSNGTAGIDGAAPAGVALGAAARGIRISQNHFEANFGNAIDVNNNGVSANSSTTPGVCTAAGTDGSNNNLARPVITSASMSFSGALNVRGTYCNDGATYTIEFYEAVPAGGDGTPAAGEGGRYLDSLTGITGSFNQPITFTGAAPASVTAIAIRESNSPNGIARDTSEFSENSPVTLSIAVSGRVFEDIHGELLAGGAIGDESHRGIGNATVRLFDAAGTPVGTPQTTDGDGFYAFDVSTPDSIYYVTVDAPTRTGGPTAVTAVGEQTYASAGAGNDTANPAGFGSICASAAPVYTPRDNPVTGATASNASNGACYGGRRGATADNASATGALSDAEHVVRVAVGTTEITDVDFGFSFNVVTNVAASGQGSFEQFLTNTVVHSSYDTMRFVPAVVTNAAGGGSDWWRVAAPAFPHVVDGAGTTIDGRAFSNVDGATPVNPNAAMLGGGATAGVDSIGLPTHDGPELELRDEIVVNVDDTTIRYLALNGTTPGVRIADGRNVTVEHNVIGSLPYTYAPDPASLAVFVWVDRNDDFGSDYRIYRNLISVPTTQGNHEGPVINVGRGVVSNSVIEENEIRAPNMTGMNAGFIFVVYVGGGALDGSAIRANLIDGVPGVGIWDSSDSQGLTIENNTIRNMPVTSGSLVQRDAIYVDVDTTGDASRYRITKNILASNNGNAGATGGSAVSGVKLGPNAKGILITRNHFGGNDGNAIDLNDDGVSINTDVCTAAGTSGANNNLARPVITSVAVNGANLDVQGTYCNDGASYTIEFYAAAAGAGDGSPAAGEGVTYLGALTGQTGGSFDDLLTISTAVPAQITAIAIREATGDTSEFSANSSTAGGIQGFVFDDRVGDLLADGVVGDASHPPIGGATVRLFDSAGAVVGAPVTTGADGSYTFPGVPAGTYYVTVDAPRISTTITAMSEQTYAHAGVGNTAASTYGSLCVGPAPTYTPQNDIATGNTANNPANGACYGGRRGAVADAVNTASPLLNDAEHAIRIVKGTVDVTAVNFGFSFSVVTNVTGSDQGTVTEFLDSARITGGARAMRFVPAVAANQAQWWQDDNISYLSFNGDLTLDGRAYSHVDGVAVLDTNPVMLGTGGTVGVDDLALPQLNAPELELQIRNFSLTGHSVVRNLALNSAASNFILWLSDTSGSLLVEDNVIGAPAVGYPTGNGSARIMFSSSNLIIRRNLLLRRDDAPYSIDQTALGAVDNIVIEGNEFRAVGGTATQPGTAISARGFGSGSRIRGNLFDLTEGPAIRADAVATAVLIENNTVSSPQSAHDAITYNASASGSIVTKNVLSGNGATSGVAVSGVALGVNARGVRITQNRFGGNFGNAIDVGNNGVSINTDACTASGTGGSNNNLARPTVTAAVYNGSDTLRVQGTYCNDGASYTIEFYQAAAADGDGSPAAGEGTTYLGSVSGTTGSFDVPLTVAAGTVGTQVTAIAIRDATGDTSEFSENVAVSSRQISGVVFEDEIGDLLADGAVNGANNPGLAGQTVRLFDVNGTYLGLATTGANGEYTFPNIVPGTYYVAAEFPTTLAGGQSEQTYAHAGIGNDGIAGSSSNPNGYGPLCVGPAPTYQQSGFFTTEENADNPVNGACYAGRMVGVTSANGSTVLDELEHVIRVVVDAAEVTGVDFGFSYNVVTSTQSAGQGSIVQFVANANAIPGDNAMRFVPAGGPNRLVSAGLRRWWRVVNVDLTPNTATLTLTDDGTTIDGSAFSNVDGATPLNPNDATLGRGGNVGVDELPLPTLDGPELELQQLFVIGNADTADARGDRATFRDLALNRADTEQIRIAFGDDVTIENNLIGALPTSYAEADGGAGIRLSTNRRVNRPTIRNNLFFTSDVTFAAIDSRSTVSFDVRIEGNEFRRTLNTSDLYGAISLSGNGGWRGTSIIRGNLIDSMPGPGIADHSDWGDTDTLGLLIENNTISNLQGSGDTRDAIYVRVNAGGDPVPYTIRRNVLRTNGQGGTSGAAAAGVGLGVLAKGIKITQNHFEANAGNAIDLGNNGVSINTDACTASGTGGSNNNLARPVITSAAINGANIDVQGTYCNDGATYTVEFYDAAAANGDGTPAAGEGSRYLGSLSGSTGSFNQPITFTGAAPTSLTAIAIRDTSSANGVAGDTSEFSANMAMAGGIQGFVFDDRVGDLLADGVVGDASHPVIVGATVRLFDSAGTYITNMVTGSDGAYGFPGATAAGTYYVTVDAPQISTTITATGEQTYAHAGVGNTAASTYGPLCVGAAPTYTPQNDNATGNTAINPANGACYGGRRGAVPDAVNTASPVLNDAEHVIRIVKGTVDVTAVNFGFSFSVVTNVTGSDQGTVTEFLDSARITGGARAMRFVPAVAANQSQWWQDDNTSYVAMNGDVTLDGRAYSHVDGTAVLDTNPVMLGAGGTVGVDGLALPRLNAPELELQIRNFTLTGHSDVRNLALNSAAPNFIILFDDASGSLLVEDNVIGAPAVGYPAGNGSPRLMIAADNVIIRRNLFLRRDDAAYSIDQILFGAVENIVIEGNEFRAAGGTATVPGTAISARGFGSGSIIRGNLFDLTEGRAIAADAVATAVLIENNTISSPQSAHDGIYFDAQASGSVITRNVLTGNGATSGVAVSGVALGANARGVRISQNRFGGNFGNAIDLNDDGVSINTDACTASGTGGANNNLARPVITSALMDSATLNVQGTYCNDGATYTLEFYDAAAANGDGTPAAGEGGRYLGSLSGSTGSFDQTLAFTGAAPTSLTAIAIRATAGDTSEFSANQAVLTPAFVTGRVILDDGTGGGIAHNAVRDGTETARAGVTVSLTNCANTIYISGTTDADGLFSLNLVGASVPPGPACLVKSGTVGHLPASAALGNTGGTYTRATDTLAFTLAADTVYSGLVLGEVRQSQFMTDGLRTIPAGTSVTYAHRFLAGTTAGMTFTTSEAATPAELSWTSALWVDVNCDGEFDAGDIEIANPIGVTTGQQLCLLNQVTSPAGALDGARHFTTLMASEELSPAPAPTAAAVVFAHTRMDTTTVGPAGLVLLKEVRTLTTCPADRAASLAEPAPFVSSNTAKPGAVIEYRISYRNDTAGVMTRIRIADVVPSHTLFKSAFCFDTPTVGISGCTPSSVPAVDADSGSIVWDLTDAAGSPSGLQPGAQGSVHACMEVAR